MSAKQSVNLNTDKKLTKTNLLYKEKILFYEKIFSSLYSIVFVFDMNNYRMIWVNDGLKKILGYKKSTQTIPEDVLIDIYHPDDRDYLKEMKLFFSQNKKGTFTAIFKFRDIKGEYVWLCTAANVFRRTANNDVFEVVGVSISFSNELTYQKNLKVITKEKLKESNKNAISVLSKRETELVSYFARGHKTKDIALMLGLSFHTVNNHRKNILRKLGMNNLAALVSFAVENGLQ